MLRAQHDFIVNFARLSHYQNHYLMACNLDLTLRCLIIAIIIAHVGTYKSDVKSVTYYIVIL